MAAWSVCLYHFVCTTTGLIDPAGKLYSVFYYGQYGVHLFFIISGMVIPWSLYKNSYHIKNVFSFLLKRLIRLEPPYLFSVVLVISFIYLRKYSPSYNGHDVPITMQQVLLHIGYLVPFSDKVGWLNSVYWTLAIEFQYYLLIAVLYFLFVSPKLIIRCLGYLILLGGAFLFPRENFLPYWLPLFGIGIVLFLYKSNQITVIELLCTSLFLIGYMLVGNRPVSACLAMGAELIILFMFSFSNRWLSFLGKISYSVYLIHPVLGAAFVNVMSHYVSGNLAKFGIVLGGIVITMASSYGMYLLVEKPSKKLSSKIKYN